MGNKIVIRKTVYKIIIYCLVALEKFNINLDSFANSKLKIDQTFFLQSLTFSSINILRNQQSTDILFLQLQL